MLVIRLARKGRRNQPTYRFVLQEKQWAPSSTVLEVLGHMNPRTNPATIVLKKERIDYWLKQGAQPSTTVHNILVSAGVVTGQKRRVVYGKSRESAVSTAAEKS